MIPAAAVGRTAGMVGGLADSRVVVTMTRSRLWIGVLGCLLGGIVALNVIGLSLSASTSGTAIKIDELVRENSVLQAREAQRLSTTRIQEEAARLGLAVPAPRAVRYVKASGDDAANAAERLDAGAISVLAALPIAPELAPTAPVAALTIDPATGLPIDPATGLPIDPAATATAPVDPAVAPVTTDPAATDPATALAAPATTATTTPTTTDPATDGGVGVP